MAQLYFLRHGQSEANLRPDVVGGRTNEAVLTETGIIQAKKAGEYIARMLMKPSIVAVSPAVRTQQTASYALEMMDYHGPVKIYPAVQELSQGECEGMLKAEVYDAARLAEIEQLGKDFKLPGGESVNELGERMFRAALMIDTIAERRGGYETDHMCLPPAALIVTHETAIKALVAKIERRSQQWVYETKLPNGSLTKLNMLDGKARVYYLGQDIANR